MVRGLQQQLRGMVGGYASELKALGVSIATDGTLSVEASKLDAALAADPDGVRRLFGKDGALSSRLETTLKATLDATTGTLTQRTGSLNRQIEGLSDQMDALDRRMEAVEARYLAQFTAMDTLVAQMQGTSSYLSQQLASLSKGNKG